MLAEAIDRFRANLARRRAAAAKAAATRAAAKEAERAAEVQRWRDEHPAEVAWLEANREDDLFAGSLARQLAAKGTLSVAQTDAIAHCLERQAEQELEDAGEAAAAVTAPKGTVTVEGEILDGSGRAQPVPLRLRSQDAHPGQHCRTEASTGCGPPSPPGCPNAGQGDRVRFVAELTRSESDETFAYAKRPRKAHRLTPPATPSPAGGPPPQELPASGCSGPHPWATATRAMGATSVRVGTASQERFPW